MSRVATPPSNLPSSSSSPPPPLPQVQVPHEKIAMRAYEKWVKRGRPQGSAVQDWVEAETELRAEYNRTQSRR